MRSVCSAVLLVTLLCPFMRASDSISKVESLIYPALARGAGIDGTVEIQCDVLPASGKVTGVHVISGPPLLVAAAKRNAATLYFSQDAPKGRVVTVHYRFVLPPIVDDGSSPATTTIYPLDRLIIIEATRVQ